MYLVLCTKFRNGDQVLPVLRHHQDVNVFARSLFDRRTHEKHVEHRGDRTADEEILSTWAKRPLIRGSRAMRDQVEDQVILLSIFCKIFARVVDDMICTQ